MVLFRFDVMKKCGRDLLEQFQVAGISRQYRKRTDGPFRRVIGRDAGSVEYLPARFHILTPHEDAKDRE